ncbi:MAG: nitronate monooxygenase [Marinilabiliales bacterium]|nr:MAG: nitronate monooxygenase [Marinilabiliales bacterium]
MKNISELFGIQYPIIQGGMIWCSGWELASAVSNAGGLGIIGSGSMTPDVLKEHIAKCKAATKKPFGVNIPLIFGHSAEFIEIVKTEKIPVVITSAGNPAKYTEYLQAEGIKVIHVVANLKGALKCESVGVDAIVAEGFEAGGHNGKEETTTMVLIPMVVDAVKIPVIAAGGIFDGRSMHAAFSLGAAGVQIGSRFAISKESSAHDLFKEEVVKSGDGGTQLSLKKLIAVRLLKNEFYNMVKEKEDAGASPEELLELLGSGRAKTGMFDGDLENGELEIGQVAARIEKIEPASEIINSIIAEFNEVQIDKLSKA